MKRLMHAARGFLLVLPLTVTAQSYDYEAAMKQAAQVQQQSVGGSATATPELPPIIALKESDVTGYIKSVTQLKSLGMTFDQKSSKQGPAQTMDAIQANQDAMKILRTNGFTINQFSSVAYSIAMAYAGLDMKKQDVSQAKTQSMLALESMRGQMSAEQFQMMQQQMGASMQVVDQMQDQPQGNLDLVAKHRAAIDATYK